MSTHTPGPWEVHNRTGVRAGQRQIATTSFRMGGFPASEFEQERADARLIAAAPDLLAACEAIVSCDSMANSPAWLAPIRDKARAALSKAKGGEA